MCSVRTGALDLTIIEQTSSARGTSYEFISLFMFCNLYIFISKYPKSSIADKNAIFRFNLTHFNINKKNYKSLYIK
jgi:hypothetical protein